MKNEDLFYLYKKLSKYLFNPEKIYKYLKSLHPERITINLGLNRIQLSRDEELIMSINLSKKKFNVEKLVSADIDISKTYHQSMEKKGYKSEEFWNEFYNQQKENKTYLVGEYNPIINHEDDNEEINNNNLMEAKINIIMILMNLIIYIIVIIIMMIIILNYSRRLIIIP